MLAIPAFQASTQTALIRANNKPPLEVVVANFERGTPTGGWTNGEKERETDLPLIVKIYEI